MSMNTTAETHGAGTIIGHIALRIFLVCCGIVLFIAAGIAGAFGALGLFM